MAIATGGNQGMLSANGDAVWVFSLKGQVGPLWPPPVPQSIAGGRTPWSFGVRPIADFVHGACIDANLSTRG
jgi:hypothetical protein